jgi:plasmid maintenance system antidote protein VapI
MVNILTNSQNKETKAPHKSAVLLRKTLLLQRGISITGLAKRLKVSPSFASQLIAGKKRSQEKESAICTILHISRKQLWI